MTLPTSLDLHTKPMAEACADSLTRFIQAHRLAPRLRKVRLTFETHRRDIKATEPHLTAMMAEHFDADENLQSKLATIWSSMRQDLPTLVRSITVDLSMEAYIHTLHGHYYACEGIKVCINNLSTAQPARAVDRLHLLAPAFVPEENSLQSWLIMATEEGKLTYSGETLDAGTEEEAAFIYAALRLPDTAFRSILDGEIEDSADRLAGTHFLAEPNFTARDLISGSSRRFAVPA